LTRGLRSSLIFWRVTTMAPGNITWSKETFLFRDREPCPTHCRIERQPTTEQELAQVIEAACNSCVEAIRYCGTDPKIIVRFRENGLRATL
jgi:hypothetical protein